MRIVVIDQGLMSRMTLQGFLTDLGHEVTSTERSDETICRESRDYSHPDLWVVGLTPSGPQGTKQLWGIRSCHPNAPIIALMSNGDALSYDEAVELGIFAFLRKPIRLAELELVLLRLLEWADSTGGLHAGAREAE